LGADGKERDTRISAAGKDRKIKIKGEPDGTCVSKSLHNVGGKES